MSEGKFPALWPKALATVKQSRRGLLIFVEVIAALTAIIALFDFMFAKRTVPYFSGAISSCIAAPAVEHQENFRNFLQENRGRYVFVNLDIQTPLSDGVHEEIWGCEFDDEILSFSLGSGSVVQNTWLPLRDALNASPNQYSGQVYVNLHRNQIDSSPLATFYATEWLHAGIKVSGLFFTTEFYAEGDVYTELIPAPLQPETERLSRCTPAINESTVWQFPRRYLSNCLF
jgi:hypothetical protein